MRYANVLGRWWMGARRVYDEMRYPDYYLGTSRDYNPKLFIDEFWMSDDQLIKLNDTGERRASVDCSSTRQVARTIR